MDFWSYLFLSDKSIPVALWLYYIILLFIFVAAFTTYRKNRNRNGTKENLLQSLVHGRESLPFTFSVCYVIPLFASLPGAFIALGIMFSGFVGPTLDTIPVRLFIAWVSIGLLLLTIFGSGYLVIRSALNKRPIGLLGWLACFVVIALPLYIPSRFFGFPFV